MMTQTIKPNFTKAKNAAYNVLKNTNIEVFPLPIFDIIKQIKGLKVYSYKEMADLVGISEHDVAKQMALSDEGAISTYGKNKILILYNSNVSEKLVERIRFTLAHELGHFFMGHPYATKNSVLSRNSITKQEDKVFETEADFFAKELLAPSFLVSKITPLDVYKVSKSFEISSQSSTYAINNVMTSIEKGGWWLNNLNPPDWLSETTKKFKFSYRENFFGEKARNQSSYQTLERIFTIKYYHYCSNCKSLDINYEHQLNYCAICGSGKLEIVTQDNYFQFHETSEQLVEFYIQGEDENMKYKALALDDEGRLTEECPNCKNEDLKGNYCSICGKDIINKCSGLREGEEEWQYKRCDNLLSGADRYCYDCGATSTFLDNGFLPSWDKTPEDLPF